METDEFFTIKEKDLLFSLYRKLLQLSGETLQKGDCKKLKTHLVNTIQNNRIQRDILFRKLRLSVQNVCMISRKKAFR